MYRRLPPTRYIPKGARKVADRKSDAVAYIYTQRDRPCVIVYYGKQSKPVVHNVCRTMVEVERIVTRYFEGRQASNKNKAEMAAKRTAAPALEVGDILVSSWGYDQTNVDFYEVTELAGKHVIIRKIAAAAVTTGHDVGKCVPQSGQFIGEPKRKLVQWGDSVAVDYGQSARKWNTSKVAGVPVGPAMHWSSYH